MLHGSETWAPNASDLQRLRRNDCAMIRWICSAKLEDEISLAVLHQKLDLLDEITAVLRTRHLRWHGHVHDEYDDWPRITIFAYPTFIRPPPPG